MDKELFLDSLWRNYIGPFGKLIALACVFACATMNILEMSGVVVPRLMFFTITDITVLASAILLGEIRRLSAGVE